MKFGVNQSIALLFEVTECSLGKKKMGIISYNEDQIVNLKLTLTEWGTQTCIQFYFPMHVSNFSSSFPSR